MRQRSGMHGLLVSSVLELDLFCIMLISMRIAYRFPKAQERLEELKRSGSKSTRPVNGKLSRKDQKRDEENCVVM